MKPTNKTEETELEYLERMLEELPKHPNPLLSHAMAYVNLRIMHLKKRCSDGIFTNKHSWEC